MIGVSKKKQFFTAKNISYIAVLVALVVVLQCFGGYIKIAGLSLNLALVPIALGAILFGPLLGSVLGLICGLIILIYGVTGNEPFTFYLFSQSPVMTVLLCLVKTTVAGCAAGWAYRLIAKKNKWVAVFVASALVPIVNTGIFAIGCFIILDTVVSYLNVLGLDTTGMSAFYIVFVVVITWNFFIELLTSLVLAPAVETVTRVVEKQINFNSKKKIEFEQEDDANITTEE
ncbi:MAG: ECF transporter S component [Candidatus Coproplasma sp.]